MVHYDELELGIERAPKVSKAWTVSSVLCSCMDTAVFLLHYVANIAFTPMRFYLYFVPPHCVFLEMY